MLHDQHGFLAFNELGVMVANTFGATEAEARGKLCEELAARNQGKHLWHTWAGYGYHVKPVRLQVWGQ